MRAEVKLLRQQLNQCYHALLSGVLNEANTERVKVHIDELRQQLCKLDPRERYMPMPVKVDYCFHCEGDLDSYYIQAHSNKFCCSKCLIEYEEDAGYIKRLAR